MLDTSQNLEECSRELGASVEQLLTPLTRFSPQLPDAHFAIDNGAFAGFDRDAWISLLKRELPRQHLCRFVTLPDIVGSARRTLESFDYWCYRVSGWPRALVIQDGIEDLPIPWDRLEAVFVGGTTGFKFSKAAADVIRTAQAVGDIWTHAGRVNTPGRYEYFAELKVKSIDGTGLSRYTWMRQRIYDAAHKPNLFSSIAEEESSPCMGKAKTQQ